MIKKQTKIKFLFFCLLLLPMFNYAGEATTKEYTSYFSNALFNALFILIIVLLIIMVALAKALKSLAESDYMKSKLKKKKEDTANNTGIKATLLILFITAAYQSNAATVTTSDDWLIGDLDMFTFYTMITIIAFEVAIIAVLYNITLSIVKSDKPLVVAKPKVKTKSILEKLNASVDIEKEHDIMLGHEYDGIRELDNDLPPWWKYSFYLTIIVGVIYMINFHVVKTGDLQTEEYDKSIVQAKAEVEAYMKTAASNVDETTVTQLEGADLEKGKEVFIANCAACHGKDGQGTVGPNLTDMYWLHGGSLADVFKSIKYGWVDKGMKSWKEDLSPTQIAQIASFIKTLNGTNPTGAKAAQGDLYKEEGIVLTDSTKVITDSLTVQKDSLK